MYKYELKDKQGSLKVKVSAKEWQEAVERAYEKNKGKYNVQGFRKGKAPRRVIEQTYGDTVFFDDAFEEVVSKEYGKFLSENSEVRPASMPQVNMDSFTVDKGIEATLTFDLVPEVTLGDLASLKTKKKSVKVTDKMVEEQIERLRSTHARFVEKDKAAENGDFATIDFSGSVDGVKFEGGTAENYRLELGSHTFIDGFEDQVVGMKLGETKDVNVTFPENYQVDNLKGKPAVFVVTLKKVEEKELPEITDKFIADSTEFETLDEYKKNLKERLLKDAETGAEREYENALVEEVVSISKVDIPHSMIHEEAHYLIHDLEHRLSHQNMKLEDYLGYTGMTYDALHEKMEEEAKRTVKTRLVLQTIIAKNKFNVTEKELDKKLTEWAKTYNMPLEEVKNTISEQDKGYFENEVMMEKLMSYLKSQSK